MVSWFFSTNRSRVRKAAIDKSTSSGSKPPSISLDTFLSNVVFDVLIQDQDDIAEITYNRSWSRKVKELENGTTKFDFESFHKYLSGLRAHISNRQLKSTTALVYPDDAEGLTGQVAHRFTFTGVQEGKQVTSTVVSIVSVGLEQGERKIEVESFIIESDLQPVPKAESLVLQAQIRNAINVIFIQDQHDIFEIGFDSFYSHKVTVTQVNTSSRSNGTEKTDKVYVITYDSADGTQSDFEEYKKLVQETRENFTNRFIVSQDTVVAGVSAGGKAGQAAHFYTVQGVENGKPVQADYVTVLSGVVENGQSKLVTESAIAVMRDL